MVRAANVALPEPLHGERLTSATYLPFGSEPWDRGPPTGYPDDPPRDDEDGSPDPTDDG